MNSFSMIKLVMSREIRQRVRSKGFAVTTALLCIGILGIGVLNRVLSRDDSPTEYDIAVIGDVPAGFENATQQMALQLDIVIKLKSASTRDGAEQQVRDGDLDAAVDATTGELISESEPSDQLVAAMNAAWQSSSSQQAAEEAGLDNAQITTILSPSALQSTLLDAGGESDDSIATIIGSAAAVLLFISINAFGGMVLTGVVEEKTTGVVEVLLAQVRAHHLLAGKVFGIGVVALAQFSVAVLSGLIALRISGITVPSAIWVGLPSTLLWFIGGFTLYSTLFALAGSFVSRQEDAQSAAAPISMLFTGAYLTVFILGNAPSSVTTRVLSVLPPFAPLLMPLRISVGAASVVEIIVSAVLLLASTFAMLRLAGAVYGRTLLHRGSRLRWKEALRMKAS